MTTLGTLDKSPKRMNARHWNDVMKKIDDLVRRGGCESARSVVAQHYVSGPGAEARDAADTVYFAQDVHRRVIAFALVRWHASDMETLAVCSERSAPPGTGKALMLRSLADARARGKTGAVLHALPGVLAWYPRFGYVRAPPEENVGGGDVHGYLHRKKLSDAANWLPATAFDPPATPAAENHKKIVWVKYGPERWPALVRDDPPPEHRALTHGPRDLYVTFFGPKKESMWISPGFASKTFAGVDKRITPEMLARKSPGLRMAIEEARAASSAYTTQARPASSARPGRS